MNTQEMFSRTSKFRRSLTSTFWIPDGALVVFLPEFGKELAKKNRALAAKLKEKGQPVVYVKVKRMAASRLEGLSLEVA